MGGSEWGGGCLLTGGGGLYVFLKIKVLLICAKMLGAKRPGQAEPREQTDLVRDDHAHHLARPALSAPRRLFSNNCLVNLTTCANREIHGCKAD